MEQTNNNYRTCPNCKKNFIFTDKNPVLEAILQDAINYYTYCSDACMEARFNNIEATNSKLDMAVELVSREKISNTPNRWKAVFKVKDLKVEVQ